MQIGEGDSEAADGLRDRMDLDWKMMRDEEREWTGELSADLYSLGKLPPPGEGHSQGSEGSRCILELLEGESDPAKIRALLDRDAADRDPTIASLIRSTYWGALGDDESALTFSREWARLTRQDAEKGGILPEIDRLMKMKSLGDVLMVKLRELPPGLEPPREYRLEFSKIVDGMRAA